MSGTGPCYFCGAETVNPEQAASGMRVERAVTITVEQADEARDRVVRAGKHGYGSHDFVYALLSELGFTVEGER